MTFIFVSSAIFAGALRIINIWFTLRIVALGGSDISKKVFRNIIHQSYEDHLSSFTSEYIASLTVRVNECINAIELTLMTLSGFIVIIFIMTPLLIFDFKVTISVIIVFTFIYYFLSYVTKERIKNIQKNRKNYWINRFLLLRKD